MRFDDALQRARALEDVVCGGCAWELSNGVRPD